jgi:hypothetical protein
MTAPTRATEAQHTHLPWMIDRNDRTRIIARRGGTVAEIWDSNPKRKESVAAANAALIVKAVNMHLALWTALENLAELVETNLITEEVSTGAWEEELQAALKVLSLSKAGGSS